MVNELNLPQNSKERIVIIGAGFAGLKLARSLSGSKYQVVCLDKNNFHQFQPLFYQVASSGIEPSSISFPIRKAFHKHTNLHFRTTEVISIDTQKKQVEVSEGLLPYDYLVIASGVNTNYFGNKNIQKNAIPMKSTAEAINLRNKILESFEKAILNTKREEQEKLLSIAIVGGGPTGVELAGALAELKNFVLQKDYPELDLSLMKIRLYEAGDRLLKGMSEKSSSKALEFLRKLEVEVYLNTRIKDYDGDKIILGDDKELYSKNLIWAAGVSGECLEGIDARLYAAGTRLEVDRNNKIKGLNDVYAIGDIAYMITEKYPNGHPQVAQVAIQQAKTLSVGLKKNIWKAFEYKDKGSMATIGRNMAVVDLPFIKFSGAFAWMTWLFVHLMAIVGVKNRLFIFINWAQSYFSRDQSLRIIVRPYKKD